ncbi:TPA: DUF1173 family protein [Enterobacter soli]|nr:DUF1173 family protein [Enterobacter soli]
MRGASRIICALKGGSSKQLLYDGSENVFPDFLLTDVAGSEPVPMEIFGMNTAEYLTRKR